MESRWLACWRLSLSAVLCAVLPAFADDQPNDASEGQPNGPNTTAPGQSPMAPAMTPADQVDGTSSTKDANTGNKRGGRKRRGVPPPPTSEQSDQVVVTGHVDADTDARRSSTASKLVFGRAELDRYGDTSIGEILKRLPGITIFGVPGRGGDIRMRGLGHGYTQILLNGEPTPRGFSLDSLAPEQVERIEIMRAPVAEYSARAIAGTINIVLREDFSKKMNEVRLMETLEQGRSAPSVSLSRGDMVGALGYNINLNAFKKDQLNEVRTLTTGIDPASSRTVLEQNQFDDSRAATEGLHLTSHLNWRFDGGDALNLQPFLMESRSAAPGTRTLAQSVGATPAPFATADWRTDTDTTIARMFANWQHRMEAGATLSVRVGYGIADTDTATPQHDFDSADNPTHTLFNQSQIWDRSLSNGGKYSRPIGKANDFAAGWDVEYGARSERITTIQDGAVQLAQFGQDIQASTLRVAGYAQDEWKFSPLWSSYAGLRWEGIQTTSDWTANSIRNTSGVLSPLLHSLWRLSEEDRDQIRLSLTRSYRSPTLNNLVARPILSTVYPVTGPNTPASPDRIGNPGLRPELAWGLDAAFEHYLSEGGVLAVSAFARNIDDLMRSSTSLESVSWSPVQRWVMQPMNVGHASSGGIELEAKFRLAEMMNSALPLEFRTNYSRFWSSVDDIIGPNNRLDQQPKQTANVGLDYRFRSLPLTLGGNLNWTPAYEVQQSDTQIYRQGLKEVVDCYALWKFNAAVQLRIAASNMLRLDYETANSVESAQIDETADAFTRTFLAWTARLEIKL
jgi:outer membrane receptor for ferrienterochelin and colicins